MMLMALATVGANSIELCCGRESSIQYHYDSRMRTVPAVVYYWHTWPHVDSVSGALIRTVSTVPAVPSSDFPISPSLVAACRCGDLLRLQRASTNDRVL